MQNDIKWTYQFVLLVIVWCKLIWLTYFIIHMYVQLYKVIANNEEYVCGVYMEFIIKHELQITNMYKKNNSDMFIRICHV